MMTEKWPMNIGSVLSIAVKLIKGTKKWNARLKYVTCPWK